MKALTVIAFLMAAASLSLHFIGFYSPLKLNLFPITVQSATPNVTLPPMQVTVQSAVPPIMNNVQSAVAPVYVEPAVPKIENIVHPAVPKINVWCPYD